MAEAVYGGVAQVAVKQLCDICEAEEDAHWFCENCEEKLCDRCKTNHLRSKKTKNDNIRTIREARNEDRPRRAIVKCDLHETQVCDFYCYDCQVLICSDCLGLTHRKHEWKTVKDVLTEIESDLDDLDEELRNCWKSVDDTFDRRGREHTEFMNGVLETKEQVKQRVKQIVVEMTEYQENQLLRISEIEDNERTQYSDTCEKHQALTTIIKNWKKRYYQEKSKGDFKVFSELKNEIKQIIRTCMQVDHTPQRTSLPVFTPAQSSRECMSNLLGELDVCGTKSYQHNISVNEAEYEIGKQQVKKNDHQIGEKQMRNTATVNCLNPFNLRLQRSIRISKPDEQNSNIYDSCIVKGICPDEHGGAWLLLHKKDTSCNAKTEYCADNFLTHISEKGHVTKMTIDVGRSFRCAASDVSGNLFVTCDFRVIKISPKGDSASVFTRMENVIEALCVDSNNNLIVGFTACAEYTTQVHIAKIDTTGDTLKRYRMPKYEMNVHCEDMSASPEGEILMLLSGLYPELYEFTSSLELKKKWDCREWGMSEFVFHHYCIEEDNTGNIYVTTSGKRVLYTTKKHESDAKCLDLSSLGIRHSPTSIAKDKFRRLWLGCKEGTLYILE